MPQTLGCGPGQQWPFPGGGAIVNNTWNSNAAGSFPWQQCIERRAPTGVAGAATEYGWWWRWPHPGHAVYAYPEILVGANPWAAGPGNDARFPHKIADTAHLRLAYDVDLAATGSYDLSTSIWLIRTPAVATPAVLADISTEIMIWSDYTPDMVADPGTNRKRGEFVSTDGTLWEIWADPAWGDMSGASRHTWAHVVYLAKPGQRQRAMTYDAMQFVANAVSLGLARSDYYIADVELGVEVVAGTGSAWIRSFSLTLD